MSKDIFAWPGERRSEPIDPNLIFEEEISRIPREENQSAIYSPPVRPPRVFFEVIKPLEKHERRMISADDLPKLEEVENPSGPVLCEEMGFVELDVTYQIFPREKKIESNDVPIELPQIEFRDIKRFLEIITDESCRLGESDQK